MVFKLPEGLSLDEASIVGCRMTTAYNAVKNAAEIKPGDSALVIGCGGVGLNTIQFLRCFGAFPIIAVDILDQKLEAAKKFGATHAINASKDDPVKAVRDLTDGGVSKAFEALGNVKTSDQIIQATRPGGTATIIGGLEKCPSPSATAASQCRRSRSREWRCAGLLMSSKCCRWCATSEWTCRGWFPNAIDSRKSTTLFTTSRREKT